MSLDLDWSVLDAPLSASLLNLLNTHLASAPRPSFIGPISFTSLSFGTRAPEVELVDVRDVYREFLDDDQDYDEDEFEWVKRGEAGDGPYDEKPGGWESQAPGLGMRYAAPGRMSGMGSPVMSHTPLSLASPLPSVLHMPSILRPSGTSTPLPIPTPHRSPSPPRPDITPPSSPPQQSSTFSALPSLQLHLRITHASDLRLSLCTNLLINYPSPEFMSLPVKLSVTGLVFRGTLVFALEGEKKRVHVCILDDEEDEAPAPLGGRVSPGVRVLPSIAIESEIGQADKHVLKNVRKVETFILDVMRTTLENEIVYPNFHTIMLP